AVSGESVFDSFGSSVDFSTDFNDDGEKDIVVGAPGIGPSTRGYISVFSGVDGQLLFSIESDELGGSFGWELLSMPDVSGDGRPEIVVGDPGYDGSAGTDSGRVLMFSAPDCLNDPNKTEPGICGCGVDDSIDGDGDGIPDCIDRCLDDPQNKCNGHLYWEPIREIIFGF
ncbi:MAG: VCBS repeat-containing protein, partial [Bdellovibrionales bacterium]|nr:VCBS repeat-containing protein [Bdellovibrionales bacterium]